MKTKFREGQKVRIIRGFPSIPEDDDRDVGKIGTIVNIWKTPLGSIDCYDVHVTGTYVDFTYIEECLEAVSKRKEKK